MRLLWVLFVLPLSWTVASAGAKGLKEGILEFSGIKETSNASPVPTCLKPELNTDSTLFVSLTIEGREIRVQVVPGERDRWKVPCTYILDNGEVVYHYCDGLHHTPNQGKERWKISEPRAGILYIELYLDTASYGPPPIDPRNIFGKRPMPYRLEYYNTDYTRHERSVDLYLASPYSREKMPNIELDQAYDAERGLSPEDSSETAYLWTYSWVHFFDSGYAGVCWRLQRYSGGRGLQGFTSTISILDHEGREIFKLADVNEDISPAMVTPDGKYLGVVLNREIDINAYPRRLGFPGIRMYNMETMKKVYEDIGKTAHEQIEGPAVYRTNFIRYRKKLPYMGDDIDGIQIILDLPKKLKYERQFSKEEWLYISKNPSLFLSYPRGLLDVYSFIISEF